MMEHILQENLLKEQLSDVKLQLKEASRRFVILYNLNKYTKKYFPFASNSYNRDY